MESSKSRGSLLLLGVFILSVLIYSHAAQIAGEKDVDNATKQNGLCYVCHLDLKEEDIARGHLEAGITCQQCHGASTQHMQDEMLMTKPDLLFGRQEVEGMCSDPLCHKPAEDRKIYSLGDHALPQKAEEFHNKWLGKTRPNGRSITDKAVCTDCHGTHNIVKHQIEGPEGKEAKWQSLFNGKDLTGWIVQGSAGWSVNRGVIVGSCGEKSEGGEIRTVNDYNDFQLAVTFRAGWPINAGITIRSGVAKVGIFESEQPPAYTGSVTTGKGLSLVNLDPDLVDHEGFNTISVEARGGKITVWLNGEEIGTTRIKTVKGKIGLYVSGPHRRSELEIREVVIQDLCEVEKCDAGKASDISK